MALANNINYSVDVNATFLMNVFLLAMAVHPTAPKILYALYGNTFNTGTSNYDSYHLLTWRALDTSNTHTLVDNITLVNHINCFPSCEMEVLLLVHRPATFCCLFKINSRLSYFRSRMFQRHWLAIMQVGPF